LLQDNEEYDLDDEDKGKDFSGSNAKQIPDWAHLENVQKVMMPMSPMLLMMQNLPKVFVVDVANVAEAFVANVTDDANVTNACDANVSDNFRRGIDYKREWWF
jgi:hypothetical protein